MLNTIKKEQISFEQYTGSNALLNVYIEQKHLKKQEVFELFFDTDLMERDNIELVTKFHRGSHTKIELKDLLSEEEYESVGDYVFVRGRVSLKYLTEESRNKLENFIKSV